jgi:hypothetical protein
MKRILQLIYLCLLTLIAGCSENTYDTALSPDTSEGKEFTLSFGITLPEEISTVRTRAFGEVDSFHPDTASIVLLAFDENHKLTNAFKGTYTGTSGSCNHYQITLKSTEKKRIFHVLVNHNKLNLDDNLYGFESDIFNNDVMVVDSATDVYWARFEVEKVEEGDNSAISQALQHLQLIRNFCKIKLSLTDDVTQDFDDVQWGLVNVPKRGTVAPYIREQSFADYTTVPEGTTQYAYLKNAQEYYGHIPRTDESFYGASEIIGDDDIQWFDITSPIYCFENEGSARGEDWKETSIMIRAKKKTSSAYTYYRIALVDQSNENEPFDLLRNIEYDLTVHEQKATGYTSATEAWNRPAGNNISGDTQTSSYPIITIDKSGLRVEYIKKYIVSPADFTMFYRYVPDVTTGSGDTYTADNDKIRLTCNKVLLSTNKKYSDYAFNSYSIADKDYNTNYRLITFTPNPITGESAVSTTVRVGVEGMSDVYRDVTFVLRQRYLLKSMSITKGDDDNSFVLGVKVPANLPDELFPLEFTLETYPVCIYADVSSGTVMNTECSSSSLFSEEEKEDETFQFLRRITKSDFSALESVDGYRTINFYFKFNGVALESGTNSVLFGVYNDSFSADPESDRNASTPTAIKKTFTVTKNNSDSYTVE